MPGDRGDRTENAGTGLPAPVVGRCVNMASGELYAVRPGTTTERHTHWDMFFVVSADDGLWVMMWHHRADREWTVHSHENPMVNWVEDFDRVNAQ